MKKSLSIILLVFGIQLNAQKTDTLHIHKFDNGKLSTITMLFNDHEGYGVAYNKFGEEIFRSSIRRYAGSEMVTFHHYPSGAVKKAHYSSQPDGGIQWYKKDTYFAEDGKVIREEEDSYEKMISPSYTIIKKDSTKIKPPQLPISPPSTIQKPKQEVVNCASLHQNQTWLVNHSNKTIYVTIEYKGLEMEYKLKRGAMIKGPKYISAEVASPINLNMRINYQGKSSKHLIDKTTESIPLERYETNHFVNFYVKNKSLINKWSV
jgi:hypothetical protein